MTAQLSQDVGEANGKPVPIGSVSEQVDGGQKKALEDQEKASQEDQERDQWSSPIEFLLSCVAMSVGLGNVWRFPFTAYENGGGAFLIPYVVVLLLIGKPLYYMELAMGQFSSFGCVRVWNVVPAARGVGYGQMIGTASVVSYYVALMALTVFYFVASFSSVLPWTVCDPSWADMTRCVDPTTNISLLNHTHGDDNLIGSTEMYFQRNVLNELPDIDGGIGLPEWRLTLCLFASWVILFLTLVKGVQSSGKVAYFTALFPYVVLITLLVRGLTLPGAMDGVLFYLKPQWHELLNLKVWYAAVTQCFFSLSTGFGCLVMFSSYNGFRHPVARDATIISITDMMTSFLAGFTIFSILGNLAHELDTTVDDVIKGGGTSLAFISYPQALANFPGVPQLFAVLFFLMLFTLGVGSATALTGCVITIVCDQFPSWARWKVSAAICAAGFLVGLVYVTPGGQFILNLVDNFGGGFIIFVLATVEVVAINWVYGVRKFCDDLEFMIKTRPNIYWKFCWSIFIPIALLGIFVYSIIKMEPLRYGKVEYPPIAITCGWILTGAAMLPIPLCFLALVRAPDTTTVRTCGWILTGAAMLPIPLCFLHALYQSPEKGLINKIRHSFSPNRQWGPMRSGDRQQWLLATGREAQLEGTQANLNAAFVASSTALDGAGTGDEPEAEQEQRTKL
ncbi:sodium-dependent nutrient amino acid transporter 1-like [Pollicipes pollicipes]|uniref:sodium-dependent nutrient amino acid transporter 1-like n=1 Tax=Pollicipes pollicipes TaxID=41117 RepID=UPI001884A977|nr:sodium-dependent nutrient amino acid transporter 1-like [Pollicipes pollicipes]